MIGLRTIRGRLLMGLSLTGAVVAAALAVSYVMFQRSDERWGRDVVGMRQSLQLSQRISGTIMREVVAGMQFLKTGKEEDSAAYTALMREAGALRRHAVDTPILSSRERAKLEEVGRLLTVVEVRIGFIQAYQAAGSEADAERLYRLISRDVSQLDRALEQFRLATDHNTDSKVRELRADVSAAKRRMLLLLVLAAGVAGTSVLATVRAITRPLSALSAELESLGSGDVSPGAVQAQATGEYAVLLEALARARQHLRQLLDRLRGEALRQRAMVDSALDAVIGVDAPGRITTLNPAAERVFARAGTEVLGLPIEHLFDPAAIGMSTPEGRWNAEGEPPSGRFEAVVTRTGGAPFPAECSVARMPLDGPPTFTLFLRDLTEQKQAEAERERLRLDLAQAQRMQAVGHVVSGVAHELNNPLTSVLGFTEDLLEDVRPPDDVEALQTIQQQAHRARSIVRNLLTFARVPDAGRRELADPAELVDQSLRALRPQACAAGCELVCTLEAGIAEVEVDPVGIEQVVTNLVVNAIYAAGIGGTVWVSCRYTDDTCEIVVEDSGAGIPTDVLLRAFEPFFTTKPAGRGTGLGLTVSRAIVEQFGGELRAENRTPEEGGGARFRAVLPCRFRARRVPPRPVREEKPAPEAPQATPGAGAEKAERPQRALVVDDEESLRMVLRRFFTRRGWTVDEAADGTEAFERVAASDRPYDLIISDLRMPGATGMELYRRLADHYPAAVDRLVFCTGDSSSPDVAEFLATTDRPVLLKPFAISQITELLTAYAPVRG